MSFLGRRASIHREAELCYEEDGLYHQVGQPLCARRLGSVWKIAFNLTQRRKATKEFSLCLCASV
jgi:hypothetical protein